MMFNTSVSDFILIIYNVVTSQNNQYDKIVFLNFLPFLICKGKDNTCTIELLGPNFSPALLISLQTLKSKLLDRHP